jgi:hypothetical protein
MSRSVTIATAVALACLCHATAFGQARPVRPDGTPVMYAFTKVEPPPGYRDLFLQAVNNIGDAAGIATRRRIPDRYIVLRMGDGTFHFLSRPEGCQKDQPIDVVRLNDQYQMLVSCHGAPWFWGRRSKWTPIEIPGYDVAAGNMNDYGDVVGTARDSEGRSFGFVWKQSSGRYQLFSQDGGYGFSDINDNRDVTGDVTHIPDPDLPYDRSGVSAALLRDGNTTPLYTGDFNIQTLDDYKDPAHWDYHVNSHAVAINENRTLAFDSPKSFGNIDATAGCRWRWKEKHMHCLRGAGRGSHVVGLDDADNVFIATEVRNADSYVMLPSGAAYPIGEVTDPPNPAKMEIHGASEAGYVTGSLSDRHVPGSFVLTPLH